VERILSEGSEGFIDIVLGVKQLILLAAVVFVVFFSCGYFVGYYRAQGLTEVTEASAVSTQPEKQELSPAGSGPTDSGVPPELAQGRSSVPPAKKSVLNENSAAARSTVQTPSASSAPPVAGRSAVRDAKQSSPPATQPSSSPSGVNGSQKRGVAEPGRAAASPTPASVRPGNLSASSVHLEVSQTSGGDPVVLSSRLRSEGFPVLFENGDESQRVLVGPFPDTETATKSWRRLREQGWNAWLVRR
jgi:hypothetical protein